MNKLLLTIFLAPLSLQATKFLVRNEANETISSITLTAHEKSFMSDEIFTLEKKDLKSGEYQVFNIRSSSCKEIRIKTENRTDAIISASDVDLSKSCCFYINKKDNFITYKKIDETPEQNIKTDSLQSLLAIPVALAALFMTSKLY